MCSICCCVFVDIINQNKEISFCDIEIYNMKYVFDHSLPFFLTPSKTLKFPEQIKVMG